MIWGYNQHKFVMVKHFHLESRWDGRSIDLNQTKVQVPIQGLVQYFSGVENGYMQAHLGIARVKTRHDGRQEIHTYCSIGGKRNLTPVHVTQDSQAIPHLPS